MSKFKDMSTIKPLKVTGGGRESKAPANPSGEVKDGTARNSGEGRREFQFGSVTPPPKPVRGQFMRTYSKGK